MVYINMIWCDIGLFVVCEFVLDDVVCGFFDIGVGFDDGG